MKNLFHRFISIPHQKIPKIILLAVLDLIILFASAFIALWLRFDFDSIPEFYLQNAYRFFAVDAVILIALFAFFRIYLSIWRFASIAELVNILLACVLFEVLTFCYRGFCDIVMPRSFYFLQVGFLIFAVCATRYSYRIFKLLSSRFDNRHNENRGMLIGAGNAAKLLIDDLNRAPRKQQTKIVCIIDDNRQKLGSRIQNIPIVGTRHDIEFAVYKYNVSEIIIAIPSAPKKEIAAIVKECQKTTCNIKILPPIGLSGEKLGEAVAKLRPVSYEDFLGRDQIIINDQEIIKHIAGKTILVTGGGGSIGSELCRQIAKRAPKRLIIFDIYENNAYEIQQELLRDFPELQLETIIGSVRDYDRLEKVFRKFKPDQVFHAAAHKHVPLMEESPNEAIKNNCLGTLNCVKLADQYRTAKFILISTDKAVRPTNIMGASKRLCEMIVQTYSKISKHTDYVAVRFGNVLGSNGSVIPLFLKQIDAGGPVTVTHKKITRYFMTISEAVSLILQASTYAKGGEIFVLDMGEPIKIYDLAEQIIRYRGFEPNKDIKIKITGLRPGEKLYEEMLMEEEGLQSTPNKLIFIGHPLDIPGDFLNDLTRLIDLAERNGNHIKEATAKIVKTYQPQKED